jgi:hypothetical protein
MIMDCNWFQVNLFALSFDKTYCIQFITKSSSIIDKNIDCDIKPVTNITNTKCLRTVTDNTLSWKSHIDQITYKLKAAG